MVLSITETMEIVALGLVRRRELGKTIWPSISDVCVVTKLCTDQFMNEAQINEFCNKIMEVTR